MAAPGFEQIGMRVHVAVIRAAFCLAYQLIVGLPRKHYDPMVQRLRCLISSDAVISLSAGFQIYLADEICDEFESLGTQRYQFILFVVPDFLPDAQTGFSGKALNECLRRSPGKLVYYATHRRYCRCPLMIMTGCSEDLRRTAREVSAC